VHTDQPVVERLIFSKGESAEVKRCPDCDQGKPLTDFDLGAHSSVGRHPYCRVCRRRPEKAWRQANRQRYLSRAAVGEGTKVCRLCRAEKPLTSFYGRVGTRDGRFSACRECLSADTLSRQLGDPEPHRRAVAWWGAAHPQLVAVARRAQSAVRRAIRSGELVRPGTCEACGRACKPDAAHTDYARPLAVVWLCRRCRAPLDRQHPKIAAVRDAQP
jgi:hypothetical protein